MPKNSHPPRGAAAKGKTKDTATPESTDKSALKGGRKGTGKQKGETIVPEKGKEPVSTGKKGLKPDENAGHEDGPKKPDTRTLIGGASWTGKLPVNLLSEHCQKMKWEKPEYSMNRDPQGFYSSVTLRSKNPKTGEITTLPAFRLPPNHASLGKQPTAVEARHFAAAYTLFRVCSMKNLHFSMPPTYRDLWKGPFSEIKKEAQSQGLSWTYNADPFATAREREDAIKAEVKKREERQNSKDKEAKKPQQPGFMAPKGDMSRAWANAPKVDMGKQMRREVERLIRSYSVWNPSALEIPEPQRSRVLDEITGLGFRKSHVAEAAEICGDREEILEWLLIHVPEDDLPKWSLAENYVAGVSIASADLKRDATVKRLALAGYSVDLCEEMLDACQGNENTAAEALQNHFIGLNDQGDITSTVKNLDFQGIGQSTGAWDEEEAVVESIFADRYSKVSPSCFQIILKPEKVSKATKISLQVLCPNAGYPNNLPIISIHGSLPAHVRLSIAKDAILHAQESLLGESMIFNVVDWIEQNAARIIENPGKLSSVSAAFAAGEEKSTPPKRPQNRATPRPINWTPGNSESQQLLERFNARQNLASFASFLSTRRSLPAWNMQEAIVYSVMTNSVTIISGETGSGKSTQSVQFVLDDLIKRGLGSAVNILCTQPRRISALGLADRVAEERCQAVGEEVGYVIRGDSKMKNGVTKLTFMTTGVLLRRLQTSSGTDKDLDAAIADVSHVFVDEVHERSLDTDFLLVLLKRVLKRRNDLKVILMSATIDAEAFERFFLDVGSVGKVVVQGRTYPVRDLFIDDILHLTGYGGLQSKSLDDEIETTDNVGKVLTTLGPGIDYTLISMLVNYIHASLSNQPGAILIFLPGTYEISQTLSALRTNPQFHVLPLHAGLPPSSQRLVFAPAPRGTRKIVAATNVAETSITIPDVVAVVDTGRVKEPTFDAATGTHVLTETWCSAAAAQQRRGRAGRVRDGDCYKLYTRNQAARMRERPDPEILRVPLEQLCLNVLSMGISDVRVFLGAALTPPATEAIDHALEVLAQVGALRHHADSGPKHHHTLTPLGRALSLLPTDLRIAKLLVLGSVLGCTDESLSLGALLSSSRGSSGIWFVPPDIPGRNTLRARRFDFAPGWGDLIADLRAFEAWTRRKAETGGVALRRWEMELGFASNALREVESNRAVLADAMREAGFLAPPPSGGTNGQSALKNQSAASPHLLTALIASSLHPNLTRIAFPTTKYAAGMTGAVAQDPEARTIRFFGRDGGRVFAHPGSTCFDAKGWSSGVGFMAYMERTQAQGGGGNHGGGPKTFIRGLTPVGTFATVLFGPPIQLDGHGRGMLLDGWVRVRGWARIGGLVGRVRGLVEGCVERRVERGWGSKNANGLEEEDWVEMERRVLGVVRGLVEKEGLDD